MHNYVIFLGLLTKDIDTVIRSFGWTKRGKYVRLVVGALAGLGYIPKHAVDKLLKTDLLSDKFARPMKEMMGKETFETSLKYLLMREIYFKSASMTRWMCLEKSAATA
jgi:hypothetical protein